MILSHGIDGLQQLPPGAALSIGNFDGLHRGHQRILQIARTLAAGGPLAIATFEPHPLTVLRPNLAPPRLTPSSLKQARLADSGVSHLVILPPTPQVLNMTAEDFWHILRDKVRPAHMIEGQSFTFGKGRGGNIDRLRRWAAASPVNLHVVDPLSVTLLNMQSVPISSSLIRWLLSYGRVRDAAICLGQSYTLEGVVIEGFKRGRTIGLPTANLDCADQMIPAHGVYAGQCQVDGRAYAAAVSIGSLPTFPDGRLQIESHLIGFTGDLYGRTLRLELKDWLREQIRFPNIEELKSRMDRDIAWAATRGLEELAEPIGCETKAV